MVVVAVKRTGREYLVEAGCRERSDCRKHTHTLTPPAGQRLALYSPYHTPHSPTHSLTHSRVAEAGVFTINSLATFLPVRPCVSHTLWPKHQEGQAAGDPVIHGQLEVRSSSYSPLFSSSGKLPQTKH